MAEASLGEAISLQGRNQGAEQLGRMAFQSGEAEKQRQMKAGLEASKKQQKDLEQFQIPTGVWHRLVIPEMNTAQTEYVNKLRTLKETRPNDYANEIPNLAREYSNKMAFYSTLSKDLYSYEDQSKTVNRGNTYFSKQWEKFNPIFEKANSLTELYENMQKEGVSGDASLQFRNNGSISFTPIPDRKPIRTIEDEITRAVTVIPFSSKDINKKYGYKTTTVSARPVTNQPGIYGISKAEIAISNPELANNANSIEDIVDDWMSTNMGNGGVFQYADEQGLRYDMDNEGNLTPESTEVIKDNIMRWASNYSSPKVTTGFTKSPSSFVVNVGDKEEGAMAAAIYEPSELSSVVGGLKSYKFGELGYTFDKDPQSIAVSGKNAFDQEFRPVKTTTLSNVKADGVLIMGVDKDGQPIRFTDINADNVKNLQGTDVFVRVKSGDGYFYVKYNNYGQITNQFMKKPDQALQSELQKMILKSASMDTQIAKKKKANASITWEELTTLP
jgi:hypothetical protein